MPNHAYDRGRAWEYSVMAFLRSKGWTVIRSAGSHQAIDVLAGKHRRLTSAYDRRLAIQCKTNEARFGRKDRQALLEAARQFNAVPMLAERKGRMRKFRILSEPDDVIVGEAPLGDFFD